MSFGMALVKPIIAPYFYDALEQADKSLMPLETIGMVGASCDYFRDDKTGEIEESILEISEHDLLDAGHNLLIAEGYRIAEKPDVLVSEIKQKSDFLAGAFREAHIDFLVLSALYYNPENLEAQGPMTHQSPLAGDEHNWLKTFREIRAKAVLNVSKNGDRKSFEDISSLISRTGLYKSVYKSHDAITDMAKFRDDLSCWDFRGGELFVMNQP